MENFIVIESCPDGSCCCLPTKSTVILISILSMIVCLVDIMFVDSECCVDSPARSYVDSMRLVLVVLFLAANMLLLVATVVENPVLVSIYICYTLGFVLMGLCVSLIDLLLRFKHEGDKGLVNFVSEVALLFVISRCLPLVDTFRKNMQDFK